MPEQVTAPPTKTDYSAATMLRRFVAELRAGGIKVIDRDSQEHELIALVPRRAQIELLREMIAQADAGKPIRIVVTKARKEGISTLIQALFVWWCSNAPNVHALTMAQTAPDTEGIFNLAKVVYEHLPGIKFKEPTTKKIPFKEHGSLYECRTAGSKAIGRGDTFHLLHMSEVAFYQSQSSMDERAITAAVGTVAFAPGTVVIMESTGDAPTGVFYNKATTARDATDEHGFKLQFYPWFWDDQYRWEPPAGWSVPNDLLSLKQEFSLTDDQLYYYYIRRSELIGRGESEFMFLREFPSRFEECFAAASGRVYPGFSERTHVRELNPNTGWEDYRGTDWGFSADAFVTLFVKYDKDAPAGIVVDPSCKNTIREFLSYKWDEKRDYPKDHDDDCMDCLRGLVATEDMTGLVYIWREIYLHRTNPEICAAHIHNLSGWTVPPSGDLTKARPGPEAIQFKSSVAGRDQPGMIMMFNEWKLNFISHRKPKMQSKRGEVRDGIGMIQTLLAGTTRFHAEKVDKHMTILESARDRIMRRRPRRLTEEEVAAVEAEVPRPEAPQSSYEWLY